MDVRIDARVVFAHEGTKGVGVAVLGVVNQMAFVKIKHCCLFLSFQQGGRVEGEGSLCSQCFKRDLFGLDVDDSGVGVKGIADRDRVGASRRGLL